MKTYEQKKYKRKLTLGQYLYKEIQDLTWKSKGELWQKLDSDALEMWIQQYKIKEGHSEWSEKYQKNIWIVDED
jgi:hypothetical protein